MTKVLIISIVFALTVFSACSSDNESSKVQNGNSLEVSEERVRPAGLGGTSAAYFRYTNVLEIPDTLAAVNSPVAGMAQVHESYETEDGMMGMRALPNLVIQPGKTITFKQGGKHIMLMQLTKDLAEGDSVRVELKFTQSGVTAKMIPVKTSSQ